MEDEKGALIKKIIDTFGIKADGVSRPLATPDNLADFIIKYKQARLLDRLSVEKLTNLISNYCSRRGFTEYTDCAVAIHQLIKGEE